MRLRAVTILCLLGGSMILSGCELSNGKNKQLDSVTKSNVSDTKKISPSPKPRPKLEPIYPSTSLVISWHANQCGGFKLASEKRVYTGEAELKHFFKFMCQNISSEPTKVMNKLLKINLAYFWPDDIKQYLWLQKQQIAMQVTAKKEQQALKTKMQKTLSSLADIEQQLLLREDTKE